MASMRNLHVTLLLFCVAYRGIPGKKCGTIIVKAEELNNCRVSMDLHFFFLYCRHCECKQRVSCQVRRHSVEPLRFD